MTYQSYWSRRPCGPDVRVYVRSELYHAGITEDGAPFHAERYCVIAELPSGARWQHYRTFNGCRRWQHPEGYYVFEDARAEALLRARRLINRARRHLRAGGGLDLTCWHDIPAAYGSEAYIRAGQSEIDALTERMFDMYP